MSVGRNTSRWDSCELLGAGATGIGALSGISTQQQAGAAGLCAVEPSPESRQQQHTQGFALAPPSASPPLPIPAHDPTPKPAKGWSMNARTRMKRVSNCTGYPILAFVSRPGSRPVRAQFEPSGTYRQFWRVGTADRWSAFVDPALFSLAGTNLSGLGLTRGINCEARTHRKSSANPQHHGQLYPPPCSAPTSPFPAPW